MNKQARQALDQALDSLQDWKESYGAWDEDSTLFISDEKVEEVFLGLPKS